MKLKGRGFVFLLMLLTMGYLTACQRGGNQQTQSKGNETEEYVYEPLTGELSIHTHYIAPRGVAQIDDYLYTYNEEYNQDTYLCTGTINKINLKDGTEEILEKVNNGKPSEEHYAGFFSDFEHNLWTIMMKDNMENTENPESTDGKEEGKIELWEISKEDGSTVSKIDITEAVNNLINPFPEYLAFDKEGRIYISDGREDIEILQKDGQIVTKIHVGSPFFNVFSDSEGQVYVITRGEEKNEIHPANVQTKQLDSALENIGDGFKELSMKKGTNGEMLACIDDTVYNYSINDQKITELFKWADCYINKDDVIAYGQMSDGTIWAITPKKWDSKISRFDFTTFDKVKRADVKKKEEIILGTLYLKDDVKKEIINFNKNSQDYNIVAKEYWTDDFTTSLAKLNADISGSECPDIISLNELDVENYIQKGVLADLNPLLEKDSEINLEDYQTNIFNLYQKDSKRYGIIPSFEIWTLAANKSMIGERNGWTMQELIDFVQKQNSESLLFPDSSNQRVLYSCLSLDIGSYVDWNKGECHFNEDEFIKLLEFANQYPTAEELKQKAEFSTMERIHNGDILLNTAMISSVNAHQINRLLYEDELTYIGYPTEDGKGSIAVTYVNCFGISSKSKKQEAAWQFIRQFLLADYQESILKSEKPIGFPVLKKALNEEFDNAMKAEYTEDENGNQVEVPKGKVGLDDDAFEIYASSKEDIEMIQNVIDQTDKVQSVNHQVTEIAAQEAEAFSTGQKTAKEVADIIQNRVQVYVDENK